MVKSTRTQRVPVLPTTVEYIGPQFDGEVSLQNLAAAMTEYAVWLTYLAGDGWTMQGSVADGSYVFVDRYGNIYDTEPEIGSENHDIFTN